MVARARLTLHLPSRRTSDSIARSLQPELSETGDKAHVKLIVHGRALELKFHAKDTISLRAIVTSYLRMISACLRSIKTIDEMNA
jgi:tRNA threonylcarbamoyladenosine modification (KEOPS) complex  Pcc1 subunit